MEFSTATKKKKRRTRKCLDEIRKRSRQTIISKTSVQHEKFTKAEVQVPSDRLITMNRLTLNMFPKAIRSETITRPLLEELRQKSSHVNCGESQENYNFTNTHKGSEVEFYENCNSLASNNSMPLFDLEEETLVEHCSSPFEIPTRDSLNPCSPIHSNILEAPAEVMTRMNSTSNASLSSQTLDGDHGLELHEELMITISSHLRKVTTAINIKEDIINNTKINLHKLFTKSRSKEYQINMLDQEKTSKSKETSIQSSKIPIIQNPMNYIRLKQQVMYNDCCFGFSERSSPLTPSPPISQADYSDQVDLFDTPECNYYPHRLN